jgi:hypothetical protein
MGCTISREAESEDSSYSDEAPTKKYSKPVWRSKTGITASALKVALQRPAWRGCSAIAKCKLRPRVRFPMHTARTPRWRVLFWLQRKREEFWDTQPHYGGSKGQVSAALSSRPAGAWPPAACMQPCTAPRLTARPDLPAVIWDALKAATDADIDTVRIIIESAGIVVARPDMTLCYDERGELRCLPPLVHLLAACGPATLASLTTACSQGGATSCPSLCGRHPPTWQLTPDTARTCRSRPGESAGHMGRRGGGKMREGRRHAPAGRCVLGSLTHEPCRAFCCRQQESEECPEWRAACVCGGRVRAAGGGGGGREGKPVHSHDSLCCVAGMGIDAWACIMRRTSRHSGAGRLLGSLQMVCSCLATSAREYRD